MSPWEARNAARQELKDYLESRGFAVYEGESLEDLREAAVQDSRQLLDEQAEEERNRVVKLSDIGGCLPIPEWVEMTWADCVDCSYVLHGPADEDEKIYDGEPVLCANCGCVHMANVDEGGAYVDASGDMDERWEYLRKPALAGLRRLLGITPHHVEVPQ